jgi:hypothetical protein
MTENRIYSIIATSKLNPMIPAGAASGLESYDRNQTGGTAVNMPNNQQPTSSVTYSMLISESVYKLVVVIERIVRWVSKVILRPCLLQFRCLFW